MAKKTKEELLKELKENDIDPGRTDDDATVEHIAAVSGISLEKPRRGRPKKVESERVYKPIKVGLATMNDHERRIIDLENRVRLLENA